MISTQTGREGFIKGSPIVWFVFSERDRFVVLILLKNLW
jgi:hypothetical protein